eukprot:TRINITY_DN2192_c1_g1_i1.p1 TRINITY_DN2192_c1_g1~~TRINITY_DN2192_c1_g1_i1.p1  ORF type:complete len:252 (+),score=85.97 TRINITY_DN2192_c1_g1_i1:217-972(+)
MSENAQEQEMEIEALEAILLDDIEEIESDEANLNTDAQCYQITISPMGDDEDEPTEIPVRLALVFAHTPDYPSEPPLLAVRSLQGVKQSDVMELQAKLEEEAQANLGMAMMYTLATSAKEWLRSKYGDKGEEEEEEEEEVKEEVIEPHGLPVTRETFMDWRDRFEAEIALEQAKLLPDAALLASKEKRIGGRQWFESGRHNQKGAARAAVAEGEENAEGDEGEEFDEDFDDEDFDEEDVLEHYLAEKHEQQ